MNPITLWELHRKLADLTTLPDNLKEKPVQFFCIDPRDMTKIIKMELQQVMVDEEGTVIQLKVIV